jgi:hypothetical protein
MTRKRQRKSLRQKIALAVLFSAPVIAIMGASCAPQPTSPAEDIGKLIDAHKQAGKDIGEGADAVGDWGSKLARGWTGAEARRKSHKAPESNAEPSPVPACDWAEFGPCDQPPPLAWFGITDENNNGISDEKE